MTDSVTKAKTFGKEKVIILVIWFVSLVGTRLLLASLLALEGTWVATAGSIGIVFVLFYVTLRYTPLSRYAKTVNAALLSWFSKRYFLWGVISSMVVLSSLVFFIEFGYFYHSDELVSYEQFQGIDDDENLSDVIGRLLSLSPASMPVGSSQGHQYGLIDTLSIMLASVDKSLDGYYVKAVSFILAEDIEILIFMILVRRYGERGLFQRNDTSAIKNTRLTE